MIARTTKRAVTRAETLRTEKRGCTPSTRLEHSVIALSSPLPPAPPQKLTAQRQAMAAHTPYRPVRFTRVRPSRGTDLDLVRGQLSPGAVSLAARPWLGVLLVGSNLPPRAARQAGHLGRAAERHHARGL